MSKFKTSQKLIGMFLVVCLAVVGLFSICANAAATKGKYAELDGHCIYYADINQQLASASAKNISTVSKYITVSLKDGNYNTLCSQSGAVGVGNYINSGGYEVSAYSTVKAYCVVYNSASPSTGTAEILQKTLK
ncbi:MAG: hypothetical protein E7258_06240 [Lachnospiraceae bacterium]|nr:hypothetical protein [Lachnospiraceae bacterium]